MKIKKKNSCFIHRATLKLKVSLRSCFRTKLTKSDHGEEPQGTHNLSDLKSRLADVFQGMWLGISIFQMHM